MDVMSSYLCHTDMLAPELVMALSSDRNQMLYVQPDGKAMYFLFADDKVLIMLDANFRLFTPEQRIDFFRKSLTRFM